MPPKKSPTERVHAALTKLKLSPPEGFSPDPESEIHENLQLAFACDLMRDGPLKAKFRSGWEIWLYEPYLGGVDGGERKWVSLGHADGGNYTIFTFDYGSPDPAIYLADHEDFDEEKDEPTSWTRLSASLSSFLKALKPQKKPKKEAKKKQDDGAELIESTVALSMKESFDVRRMQLSQRALFVRGYASNFKIFEEADGVWSEVREDRCEDVGYPTVLTFDGQDLVYGLTDGGLAWSRRGESGWSPMQVQRFEEHLQDQFPRGISLTSGVLAVGQPEQQRVELFRPCPEGWEPFQTIPVAGLGSDLAMDEHHLACITDSASVSLWAREEGDFVPIALPAMAPLYPNHSVYHIDRLCLAGDLLFASVLRDDTHTQGGEFTGQERRDSGAVYVYERSPEGWQGPTLLNAEPCETDAHFGVTVSYGEGVLIATSCHERLDRRRAYVFARDERGQWRQTYSTPDIKGSEFQETLTSWGRTLAAAYEDRIEFTRLHANATTPQPPKAPKKGAAQVSILQPSMEHSYQLGEHLTASEDWAAARDGDGWAFFSCHPDGALTLQRMDHKKGHPENWLSGLASSQQRLFFAESRDGNIVRLGTYERTEQGWELGPQLYDEDSSPHEADSFCAAMVAEGDALAYGTYDYEQRCSGLYVWRHREQEGWSLDISTTIEGQVDHVALCTSREELLWCRDDGQVVLCAMEAGELVEQARLAPEKGATSFGMKAAYSGDEWIVGSGIGAHVFRESEGQWLEHKVLKFARNKSGYGRDTLLANDALLLLSSSTKGKGTLNQGAVVLYERNPKGEWRKRDEIPGVMIGIMGYHSHGFVGLAGRHVLIGLPSRFKNKGCVKHIYLP